MSHKTQTGKVYLVGAGPGDPELLTLKGKRCIAEADVLIYDYLAAKSLLDHAGPTCECIYVGKKGGDHTLAQEDINRLIAAKALEGKTVTRLKGGDPYIFGRGGEEAEVLVEAGVSFEVVPGVTSAIAAPAYAGIPLTHRSFTSTVAFITGHEDPTKGRTDIDWQALATGIGTLVFLMGVKNLPNIISRLLEHGRPADTPIALVQWGTTNQQKTVTGTLDDIEQKVKAAGLSSPAIIVVGQVVSLRPTLRWFEDRPLLGKNIVVTRARAQASDLVERLTRLGALCRQCPIIEPAPMDDLSLLDYAINRLDTFDWIVFTSVNGVGYFFDRLFKKGRDVRSLGHLRTAAIGPTTARSLRQYGLRTDVLPKTYQAESLIEAFSQFDFKGQKVLLPRALKAREILPEELAKMGAEVDVVPAYQTKESSEGVVEVIEDLNNGSIDMITFTSSSTVTNFMSQLPADQASALMAKATIACIGPITADTARDLGLTVDLVAADFTIEGLCRAVVNYYQNQ